MNFIISTKLPISLCVDSIKNCQYLLSVASETARDYCILTNQKNLHANCENFSKFQMLLKNTLDLIYQKVIISGFYLRKSVITTAAHVFCRDLEVTVPEEGFGSFTHDLNCPRQLLRAAAYYRKHYF